MCNKNIKREFQYCALDIAEYIIWYSNMMGYPISSLKLQKLLYYTQAVFISEMGKIAFGEPMMAYNYGSVVRCTFEKWKRYIGDSSIPTPDEDIFKKFKPIDRDYIKILVDSYKNYTGVEMVSKMLSEYPCKKTIELNSPVIRIDDMIFAYKDGINVYGNK